ncbi:hypothetical protein M758_UG075200 [Ceratodon purpureus]|nr:hypothetical protein M758_UG075200 [Ceratodon purpureus]
MPNSLRSLFSHYLTLSSHTLPHRYAHTLLCCSMSPVLSDYLTPAKQHRNPSSHSPAPCTGSTHHHTTTPSTPKPPLTHYTLSAPYLKRHPRSYKPQKTFRAHSPLNIQTAQSIFSPNHPNSFPCTCLCRPDLVVPSKIGSPHFPHDSTPPPSSSWSFLFSLLY